MHEVGSEAAFEEALRSGDIFEVESQGGVKMYSFHQYEIGERDKVSTINSTKTRSAVEDDAYKSACALLDGLNWNFKITKAKALDDEAPSLSDKCREKLQDAIQACSKVIATAKKVVTTITGNDEVSKKMRVQIRDVLDPAGVYVQGLETIKMFGTNPDDRKSMMTEAQVKIYMGKCAKALDELHSTACAGDGLARSQKKQ